jgi:hypothetical protein
MTLEEAVTKARQRYAEPSDDDIEIDDIPAVSEVEDGYWVAAWVWVRKELT